MRHRVMRSLLILAAGCVAGLLTLSQPVRAEDDPLRQKALGLNDITGDDPISAEIRSLLEDKAGTKKLLATAAKMAKEKEQPFNYNGAFILGRAAHLTKDNAGAETFYRICVDQAGKLQSGRKLAMATVSLLEVLYTLKKYDECVKVSQDFLDTPTDVGQVAVLRIMVQAQAKRGKIDEATKVVDRLVKLYPDEWDFLELKAQVLYEAGKYTDAAKAFGEVADIVSKDAKLKPDEKTEVVEQFRYLQSNAYIEAQNIDKAVEILRKLVADKPDSPTFNNDLGYVLADNGRELDDAEKMIRKALDEDRKQRKAKPDFKASEDKDVAAYLDSLGWVLFKKKKFQDAKKYLLDAIKDEEGQHIEIYDHLGDVHMALGEKDEAQKIWKKALTLEARTKREQQRKGEVEKKVKGK